MGSNPYAAQINNNNSLKTNIMLNNFHILTVTGVPATNTAPYKVKLFSERFRHSVLLDYSSDTPYSFDVAEKYLKEQGFELIGKGEGSNKYIIISSTFKPLK